MKKNSFKNSIIKGLSISLFVLAFMIGSVTHAANNWVGPTSTPPINTTPPPINVGSLPQSKLGGIFSNALFGAREITAKKFCLESGAPSVIEGWVFGTGPLTNPDNCITSWGGIGSGVTQIIAGTNVTISPTIGTGVVTINATGGVGTSNVLDGTAGDTLYWDNTAEIWTPNSEFQYIESSSVLALWTGIFVLPDLVVGTSAAVPLCGEPMMTLQGLIINKVVKCGTVIPTYDCSNGVDDDLDGLTDFPNDPGCSSPSDNSETNTLLYTNYIGHSSQSIGQISESDILDTDVFYSISSPNASTNGEQSVSANAGEYIYYAYPNSLGGGIQFSVNYSPFQPWPPQPPLPIVTTSVNEVSYRIYRQPATNNSGGSYNFEAH